MKKLLVLLILLFVMATPICASAAEVDAPVEEASAVEVISGYIQEYVPEILSAGTLILSVAITYLFKKALVPGVRKALTAIDGTVSGYNAKMTEMVDGITKELELSKAFSAELLARFTAQEADTKKVLLVVEKALVAQSDSLFHLLENTNLPSDTKALIASEHKAQVEEIVALLNGGANEE